MTHLQVSEWGKVPVGTSGFSRGEAEALVAAARAHTLGGEDGTKILSDRHSFLKTKQMVGMIAAPGCSLEILPKVDPEAPDQDPRTVRRHLVGMLNVALGLDIGVGQAAEMGHQDENLLEVLIRHFADKLLQQTRSGLPHRYMPREDDLPVLRGRLDVVRQFTVNAAAPDRIACRYDTLSSDTPLMQVMKAAVVFLDGHARSFETRRLLQELRYRLADISDVHRPVLPWGDIHIDRKNHRWGYLLNLAQLLLKRDWQATHHGAPHKGITLLFPMDKLFETYIFRLLRQAVSKYGISAVPQGGLKCCLGDWVDGNDFKAHVFQTKPDILLEQDRSRAIIDTKWKALSDTDDDKRGVSQSDVYQMMAYSRVYECKRLMLLYPKRHGENEPLSHHFRISGGRERITIQEIDITQNRSEVQKQLGEIARGLVEPTTSPTGAPTSAAAVR